MRFVRPMPPTPTEAMLSVSLGGVMPRPRTFLGTMVSAALPAATLVRKVRREISFFLLMHNSPAGLSSVGKCDVGAESNHAEAGSHALAAAETHATFEFAFKRSGKNNDEKIGSSIQKNGQGAEKNELQEDMAMLWSDELRNEGKEK